MEKEDMVVGFVFHPDYSVYLIRKNRPKWQMGKLNGIGGHIEKGETSSEAMSRECYEEGGVLIPEKDWNYICELEGDKWTLNVYGLIVSSEIKLKTMTDEEVGLYNANSIMRLPVISSIQFLIPMSWEHMNNSFTFKSAYIKY